MGAWKAGLHRLMRRRVVRRMVRVLAGARRRCLACHMVWRWVMAPVAGCGIRLTAHIAWVVREVWSSFGGVGSAKQADDYNVGDLSQQIAPASLASVKEDSLV
jgi:hypothetical protein